MKKLYPYLPVIQWISSYKKSYLKGDLSAGITVGVMLIPQGMAYALIAGLPPVYGLYASIVPPIIYALFGTSRQLSVAPVAMDSLLVAAGVTLLATEGTDAYIGFAILLAFFVGSFQLALGFLKMGFITNLLSKPVISGFTSAVAVLIGLNQIKYLLGIPLEKSSNAFLIFWNAVQQLEHTHLLTLLIGVSGILIIKGTKHLQRNFPGALLAVALGILAVYFFPLEEHGVSILNTIPKGLPSFQLPNFDLGQWSELVPLALTLSVIGYVEAFSIGKAIGNKRKDHEVSPNQELIGIGAANLLGSLFQSFPVSGGFSRSAVNDQSGASTQLSSIVSAVIIGLTLLFLTPVFKYLPEAILASVIMVAVSGLINLGFARKLWKENKIEFGLLIVTFLVTLIFSMVPGIITGVVLSILLLLYRLAYPHIAQLGRLKGSTEFRNLKRFKNLEVWDELLILRIDAPITFINIQNIKDYIDSAVNTNEKVKTLIIDGASISHIDASAAEVLNDLLTSLKNRNMTVLMAELIGPVRDTLHQTGLLKAIGEKNIFLTLNDAVNKSNSSDYKHREAALQHNRSTL